MTWAHPGTVAPKMAILHAWRFCPRCAAELDRAFAPARVECPACGFVGYANSAPCVLAVVEDAVGRILLGRRAIDPDRGLWDVPGGYLEEDEHPLDGLRRELAEETGLTIEPERFLGVWMDTYGAAPDANATLNLVWTARIVAGEAVAADDVSELRWFAAEELPPPGELAFRLLPSLFRAWQAS
jgi:ADP-ribose pyrophosphatase YjhB (NUDIX family)